MKEKIMQSLNAEQLAFLIAAARALETEDLTIDCEPIFHRGNDGAIDVAAPSYEDGAALELRSFIIALSKAQQIELVALVWTGRDKDEVGIWAEVVSQARAAHTPNTADYLMGIPLLAEFIEEGLSTVDPRTYSAAESRITSHTGF